ncbi:MAG: serine/threonine-protein kinase, partial [Nannocystaceae bacterium]
MTSEPALLSDPSTGSLVLLERYRVTGRIAAGSAGLVLAAIDLRGGEPVAIKCFYGGHDSYETWLDEARLVMRLRHPNIVAVLDVGHDERTDLDVIVYARAHGGSLRRALVERGRLRREETRAVLQSVATALVHAHTQGVIHRDIKPENILAMDAADGGSWALTDFGAGRFLAPGSGGGSFAGSPGYHAPELLHGQLGPSSDQYSLGVVGVELLIGERPDHAACLDFAWTHRRA